MTSTVSGMARWKERRTNRGMDLMRGTLLIFQPDEPVPSVTRFDAKDNVKTALIPRTYCVYAVRLTASLDTQDDDHSPPSIRSGILGSAWAEPIRERIITRTTATAPMTHSASTRALTPPLLPPILLRLPLHRRRCRVLALEPVPRAAAGVARAQASSSSSASPGRLGNRNQHSQREPGVRIGG